MGNSPDEGRLALVVGATGGIGQRFCEVLAGDGLRVGLGARAPEKINTLQATLSDAGLVNCIPAPMQLTTSAEITAALDDLEARAGQPVSVVVNAVGGNRRKPLLEVTEDDFDTVISTNLRSAFLLARCAAERMIASGTPGRIVNVASMLGLRPVRDVGLYGTSKAALSFMTQAMALEWGPKDISVNAILPGYIETGLTSGFLASPRGREIIEGSPRQRAGRVSDLDGALRLLTSFDTSFINGTLITVDDGQALSIR